MTTTVTLTDLLSPTRLVSVAPHPDGTQVALIADSGTGFTLRRMPLDGTAQTPLPTGPGTPGCCVWRPDGLAILVSVDPVGAENYRITELDARTGEPNWTLSAPDVRFEFGTPYGSGTQPYSPDSRYLAYSGNERDPAVFDVLIRDLSTGLTRTVLTGDDRYYPIGWSPDGRRLLIMKIHQNTDHTLYVHDLDTGENHRITPPGRAKWLPGGWNADATAVFVATDYGVDRLGLARLDVETGQPFWLHRPDHEVVDVAVSPSAGRLAWGVAVDGVTDIYTGAADGTGIRRLTWAPPGVACDELGLGGQSLQFSDEEHLVAFITDATEPLRLHLLGTGDETARPLTEAPALLDTTRLRAPQVVEYPGYGRLPVQAFLYRPDTDGPVPVVVNLHGGPEHRHAREFDPVIQALLAAGIGVFAPNVRGSTGYGSAFQRLVYRDWIGGDIQDVAAGVDYLRTLDWVDADRLGVCGGSYGGLATVACLTQLPGLWRCGVDLFGPTDLVADAAMVPPYWRARVKEWIGDADDPADLERMRAVSPLAQADKITAPLLVIQGAQDARVAREHSDALVDRLRELGRDVEYLLIVDEGHGFNDPANELKALTAWVDWCVTHLRPGRQ